MPRFIFCCILLYWFIILESRSAKHIVGSHLVRLLFRHRRRRRASLSKVAYACARLAETEKPAEETGGASAVRIVLSSRETNRKRPGGALKCPHCICIIKKAHFVARWKRNGVCVGGERGVRNGCVRVRVRARKSYRSVLFLRFLSEVNWRWHAFNGTPLFALSISYRCGGMGKK